MARAQWLKDHEAHQEQEARAHELREARWCGCQLDHEDLDFLARAGDHKQSYPIHEVHPMMELKPAVHADSRTRKLVAVATNTPESYGLAMSGELVPRYVPNVA